MNVPSWYHNPIVRFFEIVLVVMLALWGYNTYRNWGNQTPFQQKAAAAENKTNAAVVEVKRADSVRTPALVNYTTVRNRTRSNPVANDVGKAADKVIKADSNAISTRDSAFKAQKEELQVWKDKPGPPRLAAYAEGMYDLAHMVPVVRVGATFRLIGPIAASAAGEYAAPPIGQAKPAFRAVVGLRYDF